MWIRTASEKDLEAIRDLLVTTWHDTYEADYGYDAVRKVSDQWHSIDRLQEKLKAPQSEFLVMDDGSQLGAVAYAAMSSETNLQLHQLYVAKAYQRQGLGRQLLAEILTSFPKAKTASLEVDDKNMDAILFYEKFGFELTGKTDNCGEENSGIPALIMSREL